MNSNESDKKAQVSSAEQSSNLDEQQILEHWTEERMKDARPLPFPTFSKTKMEQDIKAKKDEQLSEE